MDLSFSKIYKSYVVIIDQNRGHWQSTYMCRRYIYMLCDFFKLLRIKNTYLRNQLRNASQTKGYCRNNQDTYKQTKTWGRGTSFTWQVAHVKLRANCHMKPRLPYFHSRGYNLQVDNMTIVCWIRTRSMIWQQSLESINQTRKKHIHVFLSPKCTFIEKNTTSMCIWISSHDLE